MTQQRKPTIQVVDLQENVPVDLRGPDPDNFQTHMIPSLPNHSPDHVDRRVKRMFKAADAFESPAELKRKCEEYFEEITMHNRMSKENGDEWLPYTHADLALALGLPSRRALAAISAKGEAFAEIMDWVDLTIEACMTRGIVTRGKLNANGCTEYLRMICGWRQEAPKENTTKKTNILVVSDAATAKALMEGKDIEDLPRLGEGK